MPNGFPNAQRIWWQLGKTLLVVAGQRQPIEVHLLACAINSALGAIGNTVTLLPTTETTGADSKNFDGGAADTLVILGGNPVYNLNGRRGRNRKPSFGWLLRRRTAEKSDWNFPVAHYLESWGDATSSDGTLVLIEPLIQPLFGGSTELEFLARLAGESNESL